jgi:hypothetical protein
MWLSHEQPDGLGFSVAHMVVSPGIDIDIDSHTAEISKSGLATRFVYRTSLRNLRSATIGPEYWNKHACRRDPCNDLAILYASSGSLRNWYAHIIEHVCWKWHLYHWDTISRRPQAMCVSAACMLIPPYINRSTPWEPVRWCNGHSQLEFMLIGASP